MLENSTSAKARKMQTDDIDDPETRRNVERWLEGPYDEASKQEIRRLLKAQPEKILDAFYTTLVFGTGGMRGVMGVGSNRINRYTIGAAMQGIASYLNTFPKTDKVFSVLIGYDSRRHSQSFAEMAAEIFASNGIQVYLFSQIRPTPLVSFGCRYKHCNAAIMITASHNSAEYNGCKVFWSDGAQVVAPHDKRIIEEIKNAPDVNLPEVKHALIQNIQGQIDEAYIEMSSHLQNYREDNQSNGSALKIIYTSLHGTGIAIVPQVLKRWGFTNLEFVADQIQPDAAFPTVKLPNPEEPEALALSIQQLKKGDGDLVIATDPDGDRVAVAIRHGKQVEILTGNQLAVLLLSHICHALTTKNKLAANAAFIKTLVTTELFQVICQYYQKPCFNVLPGFKHIAEKIRLWETEARGHQFIFGAEESCGYLFGTEVRDKDALITSALIAEMALQAKQKGKTLVDNLNDLYQIFGLYYEKVIYLPFEKSKRGFMEMAEMILTLRRMPPKSIGSIAVAAMEDYQNSIKIDFLSHTQQPLAFAKTNMLIFKLVDESKLIIRPSGTEPKIKIYCSVVKKPISSISTATLEAANHAAILINSLVDCQNEII